MSDETGVKTAGDLESEIEELRRRITTWQWMMKRGRPTAAAALQDEITDADKRIQDLRKVKPQ
jgi:predicted  nucleic acid-binding Zn-ribbon protein